jgi:hypothetical protein
MFVGVHGHVPFRTGDGTASCNSSQERAELLRVQGVTKGEQVREERDLFLGEVVERSEISGLVDLYVHTGGVDPHRRTRLAMAVDFGRRGK